MKPIRTFQEAVDILGRQTQPLTLVLEDWDTGLQVHQSLSAEQVKQAVEEAKGKYGEYFTFRAFNEEIDIWWNREGGVLCEDESAKANQVFLEEDYHRYPGVRQFWNTEMQNGQKELTQKMTQGEVKKISLSDQVYCRVLKLM